MSVSGTGTAVPVLTGHTTSRGSFVRFKYTIITVRSVLVHVPQAAAIIILRSTCNMYMTTPHTPPSVFWPLFSSLFGRAEHSRRDAIINADRRKNYRQ